MNNGPFGPTPGPYDPSPQNPQNPYGAPLVPSSYGGPPQGGQPDDTMAWASVALSSLGWMSCCCGPIPILGLIALLGGFAFSVAGVICGYMAWQKAKQQNTRTDIAIVGMVLGGIRLGLLLLMIIIGVVALLAGVGLAGFEEYTHPH